MSPLPRSGEVAAQQRVRVESARDVVLPRWLSDASLAEPLEHVIALLDDRIDVDGLHGIVVGASPLAAGSLLVESLNGPMLRSVRSADLGSRRSVQPHTGDAKCGG